MVHRAYDSFELLRDCPSKIDAVASYGSKLFLACSDGSLRIYGSDLTANTTDFPSHHSESLRKQPYIFERSVSNFSRKPLLFIKVLLDRELILSLSESIAFHRLPNLETLAVITKAKGANVCCWDDTRGFLCFARQKRLFIFRHDGGRGFVEVKEFGVPDTVKSMAWCGENICLGIRKEYVILNSMNGVLTEVFPSGRLAPPLVVSLPSGELLLGKENIGVFVDHNGKLLQTERICWSEAPSVVIAQKPYAIGLLPRRVEIRSLRVPYPLIQTIVLQNVRSLSHSNNVVIVALDNAVFGLFPVPIGAQIVQLTASGDFEEALALCKMLPPEDASLRTAKETSIHIRYAHYLYDNGNYEEAMEHFIQSQVGITYVLSLYPSIALPKSSLFLESEKPLEPAQDYPHLSRASSELSDDLDAFSQLHSPESEETAALETKKMSHNTLMALIKFLQKKRFNIIDKATTEGTVEVVLDSVDTYSRRNSTNFKKSNKEHDVISSGARELAAILDTALLQALLFTGQNSAAVELLKGHNFCDLKICEEILQKSNHYTALLELYKSHSLHREALKLLHRLVEESQDEHTETFTPASILQYLKPLCATDPILVLDHSMYALETCPTQTVELFLSGNIPADLVNSYLKRHAPNMRGRYLELMLEMNENAMSGNLQNEMVLIYLSEVLEWYTDLNNQHKWEETEYSPTRKKLLNSLHSFSGYSPDTLLKRLPIDALYEERAILLGRMNLHELALSIYVHKLNLQELALSYCDRVFETGSSGNIYLSLLQIYLNPKKSSRDVEKQIAYSTSSPVPNIPKASLPATGRSRGRGSKKIAAIEGAEDERITSAKPLTDQSDDNEGEMNEENQIMLDKIVDLLSKRWDRINGAQALKLLPRETKLQNLVPFLGPLLRKSSEARRNLSVIKSLRETERLQVKEEVSKQRKNMVRISGDSMCAICNKKVGTSVFAVYPNGKTLVHFVCFKDSQRLKFVS